MGSATNQADEDADRPPIEIDYGLVEARLAFPPDFGIPEGSREPSGEHNIGILLVLGSVQEPDRAPPAPRLFETGVRSARAAAALGPRPDAPYFRKRVYMPVPPWGKYDATPEDASDIDAVGLPACLRPHNHSPALAAMPNGDVLMALYPPYRAYESGVAIVASRLRHGADEWDFPEPISDQIGVNNHAPLLARDGETVRLFWGSPGVLDQPSGARGFPFQWMETRDSGATWSETRYPVFAERAGPHARQPVNTSVQDAEGRFAFASDGQGAGPAEAAAASSLLWATEDGGATWRDAGGRARGLHTVFAETADGRIIGIGSRRADIDGYMVLSESRDGGRTYRFRRSPFPVLGANQRPAFLRLASGRLVFAGDYVRKEDGARRIPGKLGCYLAHSEDEGRTWRFRPLPGAEPHQHPDGRARMGGAAGATLGYAAMAQAPNGVVHLIGTLTIPMVHFAFNEAWLLSDADGPESGCDAVARRPLAGAGPLVEVRDFEERYPGGALRGRWSGGVCPRTGEFRLHGPQRWLYEGGQTQWEVAYENGRKVGFERLYGPDGALLWKWRRDAAGAARWTRYWPSGRPMAESHWQGVVAHGPATRWSADGAVCGEARFEGGRMAAAGGRCAR